LASSAVGYASGFALASVACHASGIVLALAAFRTPWGRTPIRVLGLATCGVAIYLAPATVLAG
jgi:hydrogenase/urease accessory protein HupE